MANTYELISSVTVGAGGASSIDFSSIPSTYTDLLIKLSVRSSYSGSNDTLAIRFNGEATGTNYTYRSVYGEGVSATSLVNPNVSFTAAGFVNPSTTTSNTFSSVDIYLPNYASSNYKSGSADAVSENNATAAYATLTAELWTNTAAINAIKLFAYNGNVVQYSTAYLYGIKNS